MNRKENIASTSFSTLVFTGAFVFFAFFFRYHLLFIEQLQVFIPDLHYFASYFSRPAALASWSGDFLTQFYINPAAGALIISLCLLLLWFVTGRLTLRFSRGARWKVPALLAAVSGWIALGDPEYPLSNILAIIFSLAFAIAYTGIKDRWLRFFSCVIMLPALYWIAGSSFFLLSIAAITFEVTRQNNKHGYIIAAVIGAVSLITPLILKNHFLLTTQQAYTWLSGVKFKPGLMDYLPVAGVVICLFCLLPAKITTKPAITWLGIPVIAAFLFAGILKNASFPLEKILRLDHEALSGNWQKVLVLAEHYGMRNNISSYYTNMALAAIGELPDKLMEHYQPAATGLFIPVNADENYLTITLSNEVYWLLGDVNAAQHSALLGMIFSPRSQNSRLMKRLAEINIVNSEYAAAEKFISILEHTWFHNKWARMQRKYLFNEKECERSEWITEKRALIPVNDMLKKSNEYVKTLSMLAEDNPSNAIAADYLLCYHLLAKDINSFATDFRKYYPLQRRVLPDVYQEALLIRIASGAESHESYKDFIFSPQKVRDMAEYMQLYEKSRGEGTSLQEKFGKTYWFYYHFAKLRSE